MRVFKNDVGDVCTYKGELGMFAPTREKVTGTRRSCMRHFIIYTPY